MARRPTTRPGNTSTSTRRHAKRGSDESARTDQDSTTAEPTPETIDAEPATRETYAEQQARLDAEAVDRWAVIVADLTPMSEEQITGLAVILNRIDARLARERGTDRDRAP